MVLPLISLLRKILERVDRQRAGRLQHDALDVEHVDDRRADAVLGDQAHRLGRKMLEVAERLAADFGDCRAIDEIVDFGEFHAPPRLKALLEARRTRRLAEHEARLAALLQEIARDACRQPAAADRQHHDVGRTAARHLVRYLVADRRLPLDDVLVVEWRHHMAAARLAEGDRGAVAIVEEVADQPDLHELAAKDAGLVDLLLRRGHRHEHHTLLAEMPAHKGKALGVVAGRRADEQRRIGATGQRVPEEIEGAADLVGADRRQVLALQEDAGAGALGQMRILLHRCFREDRPQRRRSIGHPLHETGHGSDPGVGAGSPQA